MNDFKTEEKEYEKDEYTNFFNSNIPRYISIFHHEIFQENLREFLMEKAKIHKEIRKKEGLMKTKQNILTVEKRGEIIKKIKEQLSELMEQVSKRLLELHEDHETNTGEILLDCYKFETFMMSFCADEGMKPDILVALASPSITQLDYHSIDLIRDDKSTTYLSEIELKLNQECKEKEIRFIFSIPIYLGSDSEKKMIG